MFLQNILIDIPKHKIICYGILLLVLLFVIFYIYDNPSITSHLTKKIKSKSLTGSDASNHLLSMIDSINEKQDRNLRLKGLSYN